MNIHVLLGMFEPAQPTGKINGVFLSYSSSRWNRWVFSHIRNVYVLQILMLDVTPKKNVISRMVPFNWVVSVPNHFDSFTAQLGEVAPEGCTVEWLGSLPAGVNGGTPKCWHETRSQPRFCR